MTDADTTLSALKLLVLRFSQERDWEQFHHPKDLGVALASEVGELLDLFRFKTNDEIAHRVADSGFHRELGHELADCLWAILRLADVCQVDLASALNEKVALAAIKYPVDQSRGRSDKYTHYQQKDDAQAL